MHLFRGLPEFLQIFPANLPHFDLHELVDQPSSVRQSGRQKLVRKLDPDAALAFAFQPHFLQDFFVEEIVEVKLPFAFFKQLLIDLTVFPMPQILGAQLYQNDCLQYDQKELTFLHNLFKVDFLIDLNIVEF